MVHGKNIGEAGRGYSVPSAAQQHRAWLALVDSDGPFLAVPPLKRVWAQGIPQIRPEAKAALTDAKPAFEKAWDVWETARLGAAAGGPALAAYRGARDAWVEVVLRRVFGWRDRLVTDGQLTGASQARSERGDVEVRPSGALMHGERTGALLYVVDPVADLRDPLSDGWAASPIDRMEAMLRRGVCSIGVVTDGRWWALVSAPASGLSAYGITDSLTWVEEPDVRDAFAELLSPKRLLGGAESDRLPHLFAESVLAAEEITESLGTQVRQAVGLIVEAVSDGARAARERGEPDPLPGDAHLVYEAAVAVMMRVVFVLFAEERNLLPQGRVFTSAYGLAGQLDALEDRERNEGAEALDGTAHTWHRLLATTRALHAGATFEDLRLPAYGGSLFDPARFPFMTTATERGTLAVTVSDRVMLEALRSVQVARVKGQDARRITFRDIDVEQIGYIYEGLLGYTCRRAEQVVVGLIGTAGAEPEIPLDVLDVLAEESRGDERAFAKAVIGWTKTNQPAAKPASASAIAKARIAGETAEDADRVLLQITRDEHLRTRLRAHLGVIRRDLRNRPVVVEPGGLVVWETPSRRNAGAHYTPRELAEEVVLHALEPLVYRPGPHQSDDRDTWTLLPSDDILALKVADIACGSGAFLVAAARYLAARLVEAWHAEGTVTLPPHELEVAALRQVVAKCLYGADINGMAVEMCKLSLWLVSLDRDLPFSFVDDKVVHGNSLLGITDLRQLRNLHIAPPESAQEAFLSTSGEASTETLDIDTVIRRVVDKRRMLASVVDDRDPQRTATTKRRLVAQIEQATAKLHNVADGVIAAGLTLGGKAGKRLEEAYENLRLAVRAAYPESGDGDATLLDAIIERGLTPTVDTDYERWQPLHWALAVPDVMERGGFDAVIGNPPFLGGKKISGATGTDIREWFVNVIANGVTGNADLVAYFFLRAYSLLTNRGTLGLIATNTIAQGDTREVGLDRMVADGFTITRAIQSRSWPAAGANLEYAAVWGTRGRLANGVTRVSDDVEVRAISTLLEPAGRVKGSPLRLRENVGRAFIGNNVNCVDEFTMSEQVAQRMVGDDNRNTDVVFPYLTGEDLNSSPDGAASRWIVDFTGLSEDEARAYDTPFKYIESRVYPARQKLAANKPALAVRWWTYESSGLALRRALVEMNEVLVIARVSKTVMPMRVPTGQVSSEMLVVFVLPAFSDQAVLSSALHQTWAITYGSGMRNDPRYTPSDCFLTFPRPAPTETLETLGRALDSERREIMLRRDLGLTKLYNLVNDPGVSDVSDADVARLRHIHVDIDHAVMEAYDWGDVPLDHGFHTYRQMDRWTVSPAARVEVLDRLLEENHRRAAAQDEAPESDGAPGHDTGPHLPHSGERDLFTGERDLDEEGD